MTTAELLDILMTQCDGTEQVNLVYSRYDGNSEIESIENAGLVAGGGELTFFASHDHYHRMAAIANYPDLFIFDGNNE